MITHYVHMHPHTDTCMLMSVRTQCVGLHQRAIISLPREARREIPILAADNNRNAVSVKH